MFAGLLLCSSFSSSSSFSSPPSPFQPPPFLCTLTFSSGNYALSLLSLAFCSAFISEPHDTTPLVPLGLLQCPSGAQIPCLFPSCFLVCWTRTSPDFPLNWVQVPTVEMLWSLEIVTIILSWLSRFIILGWKSLSEFSGWHIAFQASSGSLKMRNAFLFLCRLFQVWILLATSLYLWGFEILGW